MFNDEFKRLRNSLGLSQAKLSEQTGIPKRTIEEWEAGRRIPPEYVQRLVLKEMKNDIAETV